MYSMGYGMNPMMMGMNPMYGMGMNPMMGLMMGMQLMQMMSMMQMMMGQQGGCGCGFNPAMYGQCMGFEPNPMFAGGCPPMPYGGCPMPQAAPWGQSYPPHRGGYSDFGSPQANPAAEIPNFGPNPSKQEIDQMITAACQKYGVPPNIAKAVAYQESGWNPRASSFDGGHGKGIMQIDDRSHNFARTGAVWDPAANIDYGVRLLAENHKRSGGDWHTAIRKYNGSGPAAENYANKVTNLAQQQPWQRWGVA